MKLITVIFLIICNSCNTSIHTYRVEVTYFDGTKEILVLHEYEDYQIWLGSKGCLEQPTQSAACGVRAFKILTKDGKPF